MVNNRRILVALTLVFALLLISTGCGRKGPPTLPRPAVESFIKQLVIYK